MIEKEYVGDNALDVLTEIVNSLNIKKILLVTGKKSYSHTGLREKLNELLGDFVVTHFNNFTNNPKKEEAECGAQLFIESESEAIIAIGGGSTIDIGKAINVIQAHKNDYRDIFLGIQKPVNKGVPLIAIPTTAGTGSESTHFAVTYIDGNKYSISGEFVLPDYVILDPKLTVTMPAYLTACTGFDALCQAIESIWAVNSTDESRLYAKSAIKILVGNVVQAVNAPSDSVRSEMMLAANLAGKAINISKTTAPHAMSYAITSKYGVPHGHAVALTLSQFAKYLYEYDETSGFRCKGAKGERNLLFKDLFEYFEVVSIGEFVDKWKNLMRLCSLTPSLREVGIERKEDIAGLVSSINLERLNNFPASITYEEIIQLLVVN